MTEATKLAFADRDQWVTDPTTVDIPYQPTAGQAVRCPTPAPDRHAAGSSAGCGEPGLGRPRHAVAPAVTPSTWQPWTTIWPRGVPHPERVFRVRVCLCARGDGYPAPEPRLLLPVGSRASERPGPPQAHLPHHHPGHGAPGGQAGAPLWHHGRRRAAPDAGGHAHPHGGLWLQRPGNRGPAGSMYDVEDSRARSSSRAASDGVATELKRRATTCRWSRTGLRPWATPRRSGSTARRASFAAGPTRAVKGWPWDSDASASEQQHTSSPGLALGTPGSHGVAHAPAAGSE